MRCDPIPNDPLSSVAWWSTAVDGELLLRSSFMAASRWTFCPFESASHFDEEDACRIASVCARMHVDALLATCLDTGLAVPTCVEVATEPSAIRDFSRRWGFINWGIAPIDRTWLILCSVDEFAVVGGELDVVEALLGRPVADAQRAFCDFVQGLEPIAKLYGYLRRVAAHYGVQTPHE